MCVFFLLHGVSEDFEVWQDLTGLETLSGPTIGAVKKVLEKNNLKWDNLVGNVEEEIRPHKVVSVQGKF